MSELLVAGKYRLGRKLGGGSFGEIYLGTNLQTGEEVGIKLVRFFSGSSWFSRPPPPAAAELFFRSLFVHRFSNRRNPLPHCHAPPIDQTPNRSRSRRATRSCSTSPSCTRSCRAEVGPLLDL